MILDEIGDVMVSSDEVKLRMELDCTKETSDIGPGVRPKRTIIMPEYLKDWVTS